MKKVLLFGTFDGFHPGHKDLFKQAASIGDELHVVIARDATVAAVKGRPPVHSENERKKVVDEQTGVTKTYLGYHDDKYQIIEEIMPDTIALGYDQRAFTEPLASELEKRKLNIQITRLEPYHPEKYKSSLLNQ